MVIFVAEDDLGVRLLLWNTLRAQGHTVLHAGDGSDALALARQHKGPIDLLLTDVQMPTMAGCQLYHSLVTEQPDLRTVFLSGGLSNGGASAMPMLRKPFSVVALCRSIDGAPDAPMPGTALPVLNPCGTFREMMGERCRACCWYGSERQTGNRV